ncbi:MAG: N-acetylmuramoyl-L-alanine amidase [Nitrospirota bacterium]
MLIRGRTCLAAFMACIILLLFTAESYPSNNSEAGRKYSIACERLADLKKSSKKKKYRSYWMDCIHTFELVEKQYPKSPSAADACFQRSGAYFDLYQFNKYSKDLNEAVRSSEKCQAAYPKHEKAPEALSRIIDLNLDYRKDRIAAGRTFEKLEELYPGSTWTGRARTRLGLVSRKRKQEQELRKPQETVIASPESSKETGVVKSIRHWSGGAYTRLVIDQDKPINFQAHELKDPDRLVFDLRNARIDASLNKEPLPVNDGILKQVRASQFTPDTVRVVLDLASLKSYAAFPLHDPERLVIDITGEAGGPPVQTAQSGQEAPKAETPAQEQPPTQKPEGGGSSGEKLSLSEQMGLKIKKIAIDAGHGGHDPGAIGKYGLKEKDVTLDIARRLSKLVREKLKCEVVMTRDRDIFVDLDKRPFVARSNKADLFISIHVNANRRRSARGIETYIQGIHASDRDAMATAARENAMTTRRLSEIDSELKRMLVDRMLADLSNQNKDDVSVHFANVVQKSLVTTLKPVNRYAVDLDVKRALFYVLINTEMPSILAEVGFISNPDEEKLLRKDSYRQSIAEALFQGIKKYVDTLNPQTAGI